MKFNKCVPLFLVSILTGCNSGGSDDSSDSNSSSGDNNGSTSSSSGGSNLKTSHNGGQDCMSACHEANGSAANLAFTVAGTIFKSNGVQSNATIHLYVPDTNTIRTTLTTDDSGNFYTTEAVEGLFTGGDLVDGLDVVVESPGGTRNMPGIITNGSCNGCHHNNDGGNGRIVAN